MCRRTVLGPIYGDPVSHLVAVPSHPDHLNHQILAFANSDKVEQQQQQRKEGDEEAFRSDDCRGPFACWLDH